MISNCRALCFSLLNPRFLGFCSPWPQVSPGPFHFCLIHRALLWMGLAGKGKSECSTSAGLPSENYAPLDQIIEGISVPVSLALCACLSSALGSTGLLGATVKNVLALHTMYRLREQMALPTMSSVYIGRDVSTINSSWEIKLLASKMWLLHCSVGNMLYWSDFFTKASVKCLTACPRAECLVPVVPPTLDWNVLCSQKI